MKAALKMALGAMAATLVAPSALALTLNFGTVLSGTGPNATFATLTATTVGNDIQFSLSAPGLDLFGANSFLGAIAVDGNDVGSVTNVSGDAPVSKQNGGGPSGIFEFRFDLSQGQNRLTDGESVSWTWINAGQTAESLVFAAHVQGVSTRGYSDSIWYSTTAPIPEPETYALMLAGLGVLGFVSRRRKQG